MMNTTATATASTRVKDASVNTVIREDEEGFLSSLDTDKDIQSGAARHSQGFEDKNLESSPSLLVQ